MHFYKNIQNQFLTDTYSNIYLKLRQSMQLQLNNRPETFEGQELTISAIMELKSFKFKMLVVRLNDQLVKKEDYSTTIVKNGDDLKIIHLVSGG